ncbi:MAG TPA: NADPH-dependent assimilatory sulfite reductase hemoprotein subunit [Gemmataceae bacterium]|nr:NADPH-dependent assimilatory sulfite reductase hemoprotein subunit [Gemmataceae bacterium]
MSSTPTYISPPAGDAPPVAPRSAVESIKETSRQLRGKIGLELLSDSDHFSDQDKQLLKFHGTYQQEDRDARKNRKKDGIGKHHMFMVRCKIPGGRLTAEQYLAVDELADAYANGTLRFTTRQGIQLHGVLKKNLHETIAGINRCLLTTLGACGDVERNVMACPAPHDQDGVHAQLQETAATLAAHLAPRTRAYHEIWLNGKPVTDTPADTDTEPLYGKTYLPRKFKTGLALPEDNCIDIYAQDLGLLAIVENGSIRGYNLLVGGGMGMTHGNHDTFPHLARPICYVPAAAVVGAAEAVVRLFRDHGNRADRKRARIKYLVHDWGVEKFREVLAGYIGGALEEPRPVAVREVESHLGWHPQGNGKWYYGISIENGRVKDEGSFRLRSALRSLIERLRPELRLTPMQDILLCGLSGSAKIEIERTLADFGIRHPDEISTVQKFSLACPAIPTCGLAISESERALPAVIDQMEEELKRLGLENERLSVRMTGCPNGCARPYQSDIGLVGRSGDKYTIYVGGHVLGHRLNFVLKDLVPLSQIVPTLKPLLEHFQKERRPEESFGDYCQRQGAERLQNLLPPTIEAKPKTEGKAPALKPEALLATNGKNGHGHAVAGSKAVNGADRPPALTAPPPAENVARAPSAAGADLLSLAEPTTSGALQQSERFLVGGPGEERLDYAYRYNSDGNVRETAVYYYGDDCRAAAAHSGQPLRRKAVYQGRVDPFRLHNARKLSDTHYVGSCGSEQQDAHIEYHTDGRVAQAVVFYYDGDVRASQAPSGSAIRRAVAYDDLPDEFRAASLR